MTSRWHNIECLEFGTVILECKDGRSFDKLRNNEVLGEEEVWIPENRGILSFCNFTS